MNYLDTLYIQRTLLKQCLQLSKECLMSRLRAKDTLTLRQNSLLLRIPGELRCSSTSLYQSLMNLLEFRVYLKPCK
jgi:hypothetical protein